MSSFFDSLFGSHAQPSLTEVFGEQATATYQDAEGSRQIVVIKQAFGKHEIQDESGFVAVVWRGSIVISASSIGPYGGHDSPRLDGVFSIDGVTYAIDHSEGKGIQTRTGSMLTVWLQETRPKTVRYAELRRSI